MITPAGKECRYYYADFHRGHSRQECRLITKGTGFEAWQPSDCEKCPVPDILWANASEHLVLRAGIKSGFLGLGRHVSVEALCSQHNIRLADPHVGCEQCAAEHPSVLDLFSHDGNT